MTIPNVFFPKSVRRLQVWCDSETLAKPVAQQRDQLRYKSVYEEDGHSLVSSTKRIAWFKDC